MSVRLRFAPDVLQRLGEELNPNPEQGILELVRNAYDADASRCTIELRAVARPGGTLTITDDGDGMNVEQLRDSWLVLGRSSKDVRHRTLRFNRLQVGSKGLGRLAALRLGSTAEVRTRSSSRPGVELRLLFDWDRFARAETVDDVALEITRRKTDQPPGTTIVVQDLQKHFTRTEIGRLARALLLLSSPFESEESFAPRLRVPEFSRLEHLVRSGYWDQTAYEIRAGLYADGRAWAVMVDQERGGRTVEAGHRDVRRSDEPYGAPEADFDLFVFRMGGYASTRGRTSGVTLGGLREWVRTVGGVHLYHRGLRVYPYGDPGFDWLDMNLRRAGSPEERPSTNNSVGRVQVLDEDAVLRQKTDRTGFIETPEFEDLRRFAQDVLDWTAKVRLRDAEERRRNERRQTRRSLEMAQGRLRKAIESAPRETQRELRRAQGDITRAFEQKVGTLTSDLELYRTLATIGTTTAVMAHESFNPPNAIIKLAQSVRLRAKRLLGRDYERIEGQVDLIEANARRMATLVNLPRGLLDRGKRTRGTFKVNDVISDTLRLLAPLLEEHRIEVEDDLDADAPTYAGTVAALESVIANLVINAVGALDRMTSGDRLIRVQTSCDNGQVIIDVADNGPGIRNIDVNEIWLPGRGTSNRGVGLGLTIVRDIVSDLDGVATAVPRGDLGGAQFVVTLPRADA